MGFYNSHTSEITTLQLVSQILGKIKLEYAAQEPQWAHVMLDITTRGFSTGLLKHENAHFEIEVSLMESSIIIKGEKDDIVVKLENGKSISEYYREIFDATTSLGLQLSIYTVPQEMGMETRFEDDVDHHHYNEDVAKQILRWFQLAWDVEHRFIAPIRQRKVAPGLFWGTFDVSCILIYNEFESFPDDSKLIERAAFDEHMIEFGFWLGSDGFEDPTFFTLPYPFVEGVELEVDNNFPSESYFSGQMAEYLYEMKNDIDQIDSDEIVRFFEASCRKSFEYLKWQHTDHCFEPLKMKSNQKER
ncbi:DUF5996 family protein [Salimicrobium flavidum]|uniref:Uncharacterized protein n=1 Tax=Salimicrobium flavidum TaxID=570947 RepID=A0A1N7KRR3_9BACI|nr:DUF5996 family protein [Salimicrobium flavidum]SIS64298.1 hypothetical protein SAMN05421687_1172 [Salimicrobium flavidum]